MAATKIALGRVQTGTLRGDQMQRQGRAASAKVNSIEGRVAVLEADDLDSRVTTLETTATALASRVAVLERALGQGRVAIPMGNADITLTATQAAGAYLVFTGANTAIRTVTLPSATDATAYMRWIVNTTTGGFAISVKPAGGTSVSVANGAIKSVAIVGGAAALLT